MTTLPADIPELDTLHITPVERFVLLEMATGKDFVCAVPGGWYCDLTRIGGKIGYSLWKKLLIKKMHTEGTVTYFALNQRGGDMAKMLSSPRYR